MFCDELNGDVSSVMFASLNYQHFPTILQQSPQLRKGILWRDSCSYQTVSPIIIVLELCQACEVCMEHKYLVTHTHTQMECDSMHITIQRKMDVDRFVTHDYTLIIQQAGQYPRTCEVKEVWFPDCYKLAGECLRPGKRTGEATVSDIIST